MANGEQKQGDSSFTNKKSKGKEIKEAIRIRILQNTTDRETIEQRNSPLFHCDHR